MTAPPASRREAAGWRALAAGLALIATAGTAARLAPWSEIFGPRGIRLASDSDAYYHVLQAERLLAGQQVWFDPHLNWPHGARVLWPPLFDGLLATVAHLVGGGAPGGALEVVAAVTPVVLGVLTLGLVVAIGALVLGRARALTAGLLVAVLPGHVFFSSLGVADQHVAEVLLFCAVVLAFAAGVRAGTPARRRLACAALGVAVAASCWNWTGAALVLAVPVLFTAAAHVLLQRDAADAAARTLAAGAGLATALLAATVAAFGAPGALAQGELLGVTGVHVAITAVACGFGLGLLAWRRRRPDGAPLRRLAEAAALLAIPAAVAVAAFPPVREGARHGLTALGAGNPWYAEIEEYRRLVFSCRYRLADDLLVLARTYGLTFAAAGLAVPALLRRAREGDAAGALLLACWGGPFLALAFARVRFAPYAVVPAALLAAEGTWWAAERLARRASARPWIAAGLVALTLAPAAPAVARGVSPMPEDLVTAMTWLRGQRGEPGREGVLATWDLGHLVRYFARKPVVASPFGTDGGAGPMIDLARFDLSTSDEAASRILAERRIGFVVLSDPMPNATIDQGFLPDAGRLVERRCSYAEGARLDVAEAYADTTAARLFHLDGMAAAGHDAPAIGTLRLLYESPAGGVKVFAPVAGAVVTISGAPPLAPVQASLLLRTGAGRTVPWTTAVRADPRGEARLRIPYAAGRNGDVDASTCLVRAGRRVIPVDVREADVLAGTVFSVDAG